MILNELNKEGQNIRKAYQRKYPSNPNKDYYFMQRNTGLTQTLTVEYGFLDSKKDDVEQLKNNYKKYAEAVVRAVLEYIGVPYNVNNNEYIVKKGDTLYSIANKYNVNVNELKQINNLDNNILNIGQTLIIPTNAKKEEVLDYETYIVKPNDTLYGIAKMYNVKVEDIKKVNNKLNDILSINEKLLIPKGIKNIENEDIIYIVKKGDTLYKISKDYNISQGELMDYNKLTSNILSIGQVLKIPSVTSTNRYIVKQGDSLYSIAKKFNKSVNEIKTKNNLTSTLLRIGQILII